MSKDRFYSVACVALAAGCVLAVVPRLETGVIDDWCYAWTARHLAETGRLAYNGWGGAMVGFQALWGAALIRLFGFSFTLLRLSTLPFACGSVVLLYWLGREAGLKSGAALFGAWAIGLSPLTIPLVASYMTDIPTLCCWLGCAYCALRAMRARGAARAAGWMAGAALAGFAGGTIRQIAWILAPWALAVVCWSRRKERASVMAATLIGSVTLCASWLCFRWFLAHPDAYLHLPVWGDAGFLDQIRMIWQPFAVYIGFGSLVFSLPVLLVYVAGWRSGLARPGMIGLCVTVAALAVFGLPWHFHRSLLPGDFVTAYGVMDPGLDAMGQRPVVLPAGTLALLTGLLAVALGFAAAALLSAWGLSRKPGDAGARLHKGESADSLVRFTAVFVPPCALYLAIILYRSIFFDRYLIPVLPAIGILLLGYWQRYVRNSVPRYAWVVVGLLSLYGVATTHDYIAAARARLEAATRLTDAGVPRAKITAGWE